MEGNGKADRAEKLLPEETPPAPTEVESVTESAETSERPGVRLRAGPDLILDERLNSAAAPFLYLVAIILVAVAGYFVYTFLRG